MEKSCNNHSMKLNAGASMMSIVFVVLIALALSGCEPDGHSSHHQAGAHVHGIARLNVALDGEKQLTIELAAPAARIYGFEYTPTTETDRKIQADALARLKTDFAALLGVDPAAGCRAVSSTVEVRAENHNDHADHDEHGEHHDEGGSGEHSEVYALYTYQCDQPVRASGLRPRLHQAFAHLETIEVQVIGDELQRSQVIAADDAENARITF